MTTVQVIITIAVITVATALTRFTPFILFPANKKAPKFITYLGGVLPYAIMGMLVIYCFKSVSFFSAPFGLPEIIAGIFVVAVHKWKHNIFLSIAGGTAIYMLLVRLVFA